MPISLTSRGREVFESVEVRDPSGQRRTDLGPLSPSTTMAEIRASRGESFLFARASGLEPALRKQRPLAE